MLRTLLFSLALISLLGCSDRNKPQKPAAPASTGEDEAASAPNQAAVDMTPATSMGSTSAMNSDPEPSSVGASNAEPNAPGMALRARGRNSGSVAHARVNGPRVRALLKRGRGLARAGDHTAALPIFEQALELNPNNYRLRCETGFIAHKAGSADKARRLVEQAMRAAPPDPVPAHLRVPTAMCLYNVGLVLQAADDTAGARAAFTRSVALRPNRVVQGKLDRLAAPTPSAGNEASPLRSGPLDTSATTISQTRLLLEARYGEDYGCDDARLTSIPITGEPRLSVGLFSFECEYAVGLVMVGQRQGQSALVMRELEMDDSQGGGISSAFDISRARFEQFVPGGSPELLFRLGSGWGTYDYANCSEEGASQTALHICNADFECAELLLEHTTTSHVDCPCCEDEDDCGQDECDDDNSSSEVRWELQREGDRVVRRVVSVDGDPDGEGEPPELGASRSCALATLFESCEI